MPVSKRENFKLGHYQKTLKEIGPRLDEHEVPYSEEPDREEIVIAELQKRLPDTDIKPARTSGT